MVIGKDSVLDKFPDLRKQYSLLDADIKNFGATGSKSYKQITNDIGGFNNQLKKSSLEFKNVNKDGYSFTEMLGIATKKFLIWQLGVGGVMMAIRGLQDGVKYIMDLDNALNEIRIVTGQSEERVASLATQYNKLAKEMSVTTAEIAKQSAELYRQGLTQDEVIDRMKSIVMYSKISGITLEESNKIITATMNATGRSATEVIDIMSQLGDQTAAGADEIGEALQKVASTADNMGVSLEKASSWIATISSITRESAQNIGNSLKSIMSRYAAIKERGFNDEDATKLNDVTKALTSIGITAVDSMGQLRDFSDVMDDVGERWTSLKKNEQAYLATTMAGTFQRNRYITLMDNYSTS